MEKVEKKYFIIENEQFPKDKEIYPFNIHLYNKSNQIFNVFLHANSPLTEEKLEFLDLSLKKGAQIAITIGQKNTFLSFTKLKESDIKDLQDPVKHELEIKREKSKEVSGKFEGGITSIVKEATVSEDFQKAIDFLKQTISIYNVNISNTVTLATKFSEEILVSDNPSARILALSYALAIQLQLETESLLSDLICAVFLHHIGFTQMDYKLSSRPYLELNDYEKKIYNKHPWYAHHLIRKCGIKLSKNSLNLILDHHERASGLGFPLQKKQEHLSPLALVLGVSSHIIDFSSGKINGSKMPIKSTISLITKKTPTLGLENDFGVKILKSLEDLIS